MAEISKEERWKAFAAAGTPGEQHRRLGRAVGTWDTVGRMWTEGPGGPVSTGAPSVSLPGQQETVDYDWFAVQHQGVEPQAFHVDPSERIR